jgi:hypothetical protein
MRKYEMKRTEKKSEEPKVRATMNVPKVKVEAPAKAPLKTTASDLSTVGTDIASLVADYGTAPTPRSSVTAKQLKDANRILNRMKGQKQGT